MVKASKASGRILLASPDKTMLALWHNALAEEGVFLQEATTRSAMEQCVASNHPDLLLLDQALINATDSENFALLSQLSQHVRILLVQGDRYGQDPLPALKAGVCGYCDRETPPSLLHKAVQAIQLGEVWIPRGLIPQLLDELSTRSEVPALSVEQRECLQSLTPREKEVAKMIYQSANNKTIARQLNISERTVKAHLSAIFRKLNVPNRLHLALFFKELA